MQFLRFFLTFSIAIATLLIAGREVSAQKQPDKMTVSYSASGGQYINLFVAKELGIFEKHKLDVTLNQINSSSQAVASLQCYVDVKSQTRESSFCLWLFDFPTKERLPAIRGTAAGPS